MQVILDFVMTRRAATLAERLRPFLPAAGRGLDIGAGTGHNVQALQARSQVRFVEIDLTDLRVIEGIGVCYDGQVLPFADQTFQCALLIFILQYPPNPAHALREAKRVTQGPLLVVQSTYQGAVGRWGLRVNEILWGPVAFAAARLLRWVKADQFTLNPQCVFTRPELYDLFQTEGLRVSHLQPRPWPGLPISYDLFILE